MYGVLFLYFSADASEWLQKVDLKFIVFLIDHIVWTVSLRSKL